MPLTAFAGSVSSNAVLAGGRSNAARTIGAARFLLSMTVSRPSLAPWDEAMLAGWVAAESAKNSGLILVPDP